MSRIQLEDTVITMFTKMCDGNPGALTALMAIFKEAPTIDPQSALGGLGPILIMDDLGVYGSHIWLLFKDICKQDTRMMVAIIRAYQMGFLAESDLKNAIQACEGKRSFGTEAPGHSLDVPALVAKVEEALVEFQKAPVPEITS